MLNLYSLLGKDASQNEVFLLPAAKLPPEVFDAFTPADIFQPDTDEATLTIRQAFEFLACANSDKQTSPQENYTVEEAAKEGNFKPRAYIVRSFATESDLKKFTSALLRLPEDSSVTLSLQAIVCGATPQMLRQLPKRAGTWMYPGSALENISYEGGVRMSFSDPATAKSYLLNLVLLVRGKVNLNKPYTREPDDPCSRPPHYFPRWVDEQLMKTAFARDFARNSEALVQNTHPKTVKRMH
jgi:hypothetical protein